MRKSARSPDVPEKSTGLLLTHIPVPHNLKQDSVKALHYIHPSLHWGGTLKCIKMLIDKLLDYFISPLCSNLNFNARKVKHCRAKLTIL
jgi:hypothetical protein